MSNAMTVNHKEQLTAAAQSKNAASTQGLAWAGSNQQNLANHISAMTTMASQMQSVGATYSGISQAKPESFKVTHQFHICTTRKKVFLMKAWIVENCTEYQFDDAGTDMYSTYASHMVDFHCSIADPTEATNFTLFWK